MAKQEQQSGLLAKLGNRLQTAFEAHKHDETEFGNVELPSGIRGGLAKLETCGFGVYKTGKFEGEPFFRASASVLDPVVFEDSKGRKYRTQGQFTNIGPEPLCDTPERTRPTLKDHVAWVLNELRKLGVDTANIQWNQLEAVCSMLVADKKNNPIYLRFDTFGGPTDEDPNGRINHKWLGPASAEEAQAAITAAQSNEEQDDSGNVPPPPVRPATQPAGRPALNGNGAGPKKPTGPVQREAAAATATAAPGGAKTPVKPGKAQAPAPAPEPEPQPEEPAYADDTDIVALAERAQAGDAGAAELLADQARGMGYTDDQIVGAPTWVRLGEEMAAGTDPAEVAWEAAEGAEGGDEAAAPEWQPAVGETYGYRPVSPTTKKPAAKPVAATVTAVNAAKKTVDMENAANGKLKYKGVSWSDLESAPE
jgi:hypothetical protein